MPEQTIAPRSSRLVSRLAEGAGPVVFSTAVAKYRRPRMVVDSVLGRSLEDAVRGRVVAVTGASEGIGRSVAVRVAQAGATVLLVARTRERLEELAEEIRGAGGTAHVHTCDMSDVEDVARLGKEMLAEHERVDVLVNNAGRSIRRSIEDSYDRLHDYQRTMQINYFGALQLILALLPSMRANKRGHIVNISSGGVQARASRFSAYVASKAALDAFSDCVQAEVKHDDIHFTTIFMPLVRTAMIAPTKAYDRYPALTTGQAADIVEDALIHRPRRLGTLVPSMVMVADAVSPALTDSLRSLGFRLFAEPGGSTSSKSGSSPTGVPARAFAAMTRGIHW